jgi:hypothetical protein
MHSFLKEWGTIYSILSGIADLGRLEHWAALYSELVVHRQNPGTQ